ncbi:hypothetical protein BVRB_5g124810 [Beta vulgaris subsp. vulgaris]|uniref:WEB family protein n=1 Tax=Beta vulgaris subsp. vulgaris TaxID=3555 RepID=A0A0J8B9P4_BETVV|nr:WEB family protein At1g75720 [Beta vulgaris subsp. vulgaris]XP_048503352.1 WEB family protein At1g75720 [Beta vulgaris subsp. vulgaris]KMS97676.1 hypothetical protein BVRB_5g124810 [Beta vulgaris subsp. vulgaris]
MADSPADGVVVLNRRAEIDTRAPFRSVKEAVSLFGERVLAGEVYAGKLREMDKNASNQKEEGNLEISIMTNELEETKESLQKAKEETIVMATCLSSLEEELEKTKRELQELKLERESEKQMMEFEMEDLKFVEDNPPITTTSLQRIRESERLNNGNLGGMVEFENRRYVSFAKAPFSEVVAPDRKSGPFLERHASLKKKKRQPLIPLIGSIFNRKKKNSEVASAKTP